MIDINIEQRNSSDIEQNFERKASMVEFVLGTIKGILSEDKFGIFQLKSAANLDAQNEQINSQIEKLVELLSRGKAQVDSLSKEIETLQTKNNSVKQNLLQIL